MTVEGSMIVSELIRVLKTLDPTFRVELYVTHEGKGFHSDLISVATDHKRSVSLNDSKFEYSLDIPPE